MLLQVSLLGCPLLLLEWQYGLEGSLRRHRHFHRFPMDRHSVVSEDCSSSMSHRSWLIVGCGIDVCSVILRWMDVPSAINGPV